MPAEFELPLLDSDQSLDAALRQMRRVGTHALVVSAGVAALRILTSKQLLHAKRAGRRRLAEVGARGLVVGRPAARTGTALAAGVDEEAVGRLFGRSRARYLLAATAGSRARIISRHEGYLAVLSAGAACICSHCDSCADSPPVNQGDNCSVCGRGTYDCY